MQPEEPLTLPLAYHHILQSALYQALKEEGQKDSFYHSSAPAYGQRLYRLFTFGPLQGKYSIQGKQICFQDTIRLEIRSADLHCIQLLYHNLTGERIRLGRTYCRVTDARMDDSEVEGEDLLIRMLSPICVFQTDPETGYVTYWAPNQEEFSRYVNDNFQRKYQAACGIAAKGDIEIYPVEVTGRDKYVTRYKNSIISGWKGVYQLKGKRKYLDFLYQTGLGAKNAQGFGMFEILEQE